MHLRGEGILVPKALSKGDPGQERDHMDVMGNFLSLFTLIQEVCFQSLVSCGLAGLPRYQFSAELNERRHLDERESFVF